MDPTEHVKELETEEEHERALARLEEMMDANQSCNDDEIELLIELIVRYEDKHYPIDPPDSEDVPQKKRNRANEKAQEPV